MFSSEHLSIVHSNGSPQGSPLWVQVPSTQVSVPLQKMSSLHGAVLLTWPQPVAGSHVSAVQALLSLQFGAAPPTQVPPEHVSPVVHALLSSHGAVLFVWTQRPLVASQVSVVQTLPSSQVAGHATTTVTVDSLES